jgi:Flp pilus assembly protein TadG
MVPVRKLASTRKRESGGAAVEFAIVFPVFCAVLFGIVDYGWYFYQRSAVVNAVRDGVRYGVTKPLTGDTPWTEAQTRADLDLTASNVGKTGITWGPATHVSGSFPTKVLTLTCTIPFKPLVGFVKVPSNLFASVTMLLELQ